jgi:hypothetical protein
MIRQVVGAMLCPTDANYENLEMKVKMIFDGVIYLPSGRIEETSRPIFSTIPV